MKYCNIKLLWFYLTNNYKKVPASWLIMCAFYFQSFTFAYIIVTFYCRYYFFLCNFSNPISFGNVCESILEMELSFHRTYNHFNRRAIVLLFHPTENWVVPKWNISKIIFRCWIWLLSTNMKSLQIIYFW